MFFPAWHEAFTEKNVASSWRKAGLFPFDPDVVLSQVRDPKQASFCQSIANRQLSSSPPVCFDSPSVNRRPRKMISRAVDKKTKKWMTQLTEDSEVNGLVGYGFGAKTKPTSPQRLQNQNNHW